MVRTRRLILTATALAWALAPGPAAADSLAQFSSQLSKAEAAVPGLKRENQARVHFHNPAQPARTELSFLYLHGFSASPRESSPLTESLAQSFSANAYFPRFHGHGIQGTDGLRGVKLENWEEETRKALNQARKLGNRVVVVAMSTGASLALPVLLENQQNVAALVMLSPNFRLYKTESELLRLPFGEWIARIFLGEYHQWKARNKEHEHFWTTKYPSEVAVQAVRAAAKARNLELHGITAVPFV